MTPKQKTPAVKNLTHFFIFAILLIIAAIGFALYVAFDTLPPYAATVNQKLAEANLISDNDTASSSHSLNRRSALFFSAPSTALVQVTKDVQKYAELSGASINSVVPAGEATTNTLPVSISFAKPLPYASFVQFLATLEGSTPHISVTSLKITQPNSDSQDIQVTALLVNVAIE